MATGFLGRVLVEILWAIQNTIFEGSAMPSARTTVPHFSAQLKSPILKVSWPFPCVPFSGFHFQVCHCFPSFFARIVRLWQKKVIRVSLLWATALLH